MADGTGANPLAYNSTWQIRNDAWCSLEETSAQLVLAGAQHRSVDELAITAPLPEPPAGSPAAAAAANGDSAKTPAKRARK